MNAKLAQSFNQQISSSGHIDFNITAQGALKTPDLEGQVNFNNVNLAYQQIPNGISHLNGAMVFNQEAPADWRLLHRSLRLNQRVGRRPASPKPGGPGR